jgi:hypothetical protein
MVCSSENTIGYKGQVSYFKRFSVKILAKTLTIPCRVSYVYFGKLSFWAWIEIDFNPFDLARGLQLQYPEDLRPFIQALQRQL